MPSSSPATVVACGVDVGSTNTKIVALAPDGRVVARSSRPTPREADDRSIDADGLVDAIETMILEVCAEGLALAAAAVAGVGEDGVLVDVGMRPIGRALAWFDHRRDRVFEEIAPELEPVAGLPVPTESSRTIFGWRWAMQQPGAGRATSWISLTDYAGSRWSGRAFMGDTIASRTAAWEPATRAWVGSRIDVTLGDRRLLPEVLHSGEVVGPWRSGRLQEAGVLAPGAVVVAGGHDHPVGGWGVDRMHAGAVLDSMGTAEVVVAQTARPLVQRSERVDVAPGIRQPGTTLLCVEELAHNMDWASRDPEVGIALRSLVTGDLAPDEHLTSGVFIPGPAGGDGPRFVDGAPLDPLSRASAVVGALAELGELAIARVADRTGAASTIFAAGGWSRAAGWVRLKEQVTGRTMRVVPEPEVTAVGAALLAAEGIGWTPSAALALDPGPGSR